MQINEYWQSEPCVREDVRNTIAQADLRKYAADYQMILYKGKLYASSDVVPCDCEMEAPDHCFEETLKICPATWTDEEKAEKVCHCPCHTYYEPW